MQFRARWQPAIICAVCALWLSVLVDGMALCAQPGLDAGKSAAATSTSVQSKTDQLIARLSAKAKQNPGSADDLNRLGEALMQKGRETGTLSWYMDADKTFRSAAQLDPSSSVSFHNLAWACTIRHRFREAIDYAQQAIQKNDSDHIAYGLLADSYMELGDYDKALGAAQKMIDIRPDLSSYSRGAQLRWWYGNAEGAMQLMRQAAEAGGPHAENTAWCRVQLGDMYFKIGSLQAAEQQYQIALEGMPAFRHALAGMARVRMAQNKLPEAADLFEKATAGTPQIAYVVELGDLYRKMGKADDAEKQYARIEPLVADHLKQGIEGDELTLAMFYLDHDRKLPEALQLAEAEVKEGHQSVQAYATRAWAYYKLNRYADAKKDIEQAMRLHTQDALLLYRAGKIYQAAGDAVQMRQCLSKAIALNPSFHAFYADDAFRSLQSIAATRPGTDPKTKP